MEVYGYLYGHALYILVICNWFDSNSFLSMFKTFGDGLLFPFGIKYTYVTGIGVSYFSLVIE